MGQRHASAQGGLSQNLAERQHGPVRAEIPVIITASTKDAFSGLALSLTIHGFSRGQAHLVFIAFCRTFDKFKWDLLLDQT